MMNVFIILDKMDKIGLQKAWQKNWKRWICKEECRDLSSLFKDDADVEGIRFLKEKLEGYLA